MHQIVSNNLDSKFAVWWRKRSPDIIGLYADEIYNNLVAHNSGIL